MLKTEDGDALIHTRKQQLQIKRLGLLVSFPGTTTNNCGEIAVFFTDVFSLFVLVCLCPHGTTFFQLCSPKQQPSANL